MILRNCSIYDFVNIANKKELFCFGAAKMPREICEEYPEIHFMDMVNYFVDNSIEKQDTYYEYGGKKKKIVSPSQMENLISENAIILITSRYYIDIFEQLNQIDRLKNTSCFIWPAIAPQYKSDSDFPKQIQRYMGTNQLIPRTLHYIWFGNSEFSELEKQCMESWKKYMPDYEIIRWDESNYDYKKNEYMKKAYEAGKWAFVSDYARLDIICRYGGIYLDTDVEVVKSFDELLKLDGFMGFESKQLIATGLGFGGIKGNKMLERLREEYDNMTFDEDNLIACPYIETRTLLENGLRLDNHLQRIGDLTILPAECLSPDNNHFVHLTENTFSIHRFAGSWTTEDNKKWLAKSRIISNRLENRTNL